MFFLSRNFQSSERNTQKHNLSKPAQIFPFSPRSCCQELECSVQLQSSRFAVMNKCKRKGEKNHKRVQTFTASILYAILPGLCATNNLFFHTTINNLHKEITFSKSTGRTCSNRQSPTTCGACHTCKLRHCKFPTQDTLLPCRLTLFSHRP
jgi:hypothetical protein